MNGPQVRGQPLVALLAILGGWMGGRAITWEPPAFIEGAAASETVRASILAPTGFAFDPVAGPQSLPGAGAAEPIEKGPTVSAISPVISYGTFYGMARSGAEMPSAMRPGTFPLWNPAGHEWGPSARGLAPSSAGLHQAAAFIDGTFEASLPDYSSFRPLNAFSGQPVPPATAGPSATPPGAIRLAETKLKRWSGDSWMLMRSGGGGALAAGALPATYGASQAGTVLRYRLATRDDHRPSAYMRVTSSLGQLRETSAALGLSARPLPKVPVVAALEGRITDQGGSRHIQPAAMAVTEFAPFELPLGMRGEAYAQAGYVGGTFATPFADGQFRLDRPLLSYGALQARLGAGVWGGAQKGAGRLDFGPTAAVSMPLGRRIFGRMALDWRFRVLGNAQPQSGPALTLSAGF
ncbi:MAG TPA: hypothetical protein VJQ77_05080 [Novosphingobium sp.]|nr:hypothetical protein [Novosphingobium sp.]